MKFLALLAVLLIEQVWPLRHGNAVHALFERAAQYLQNLFDAGQYRQGVIAWTLAVVPLTLVVLVGEWLLTRAGVPLALMLAIGVLYLTVGFRRFGNLFNEINNLIKDGEIAAARAQLRRWRDADCGELTANEVARVTIELGLMSAHRHVFGPVAWFLLLGPVGALLYWLAALLHAQWQVSVAPNTSASSEFVQFAARAFAVIDWLPTRLTAASFAAVGNFQDAIDCWRAQSSNWPDAAQGIILASGAGALGVKLGGELHEEGGVRYREILGNGDEADTDYLSSAVGLIWRAMVMWMVLVGVVTIAHSLG